MLNKIVLYNGEGVSQTLQRALVALCPDALLLTAEELLHSDWDQPGTILIIPGGRDRPYHEDLKGAGNQKIRRFVENGGSYLGICAGAYFASSFIDFERGNSNEISEARELGFFPGCAIGPAYGLSLYDPHSDRGVRTAQILYKDRIWPVYYNGGPTFEGEFSTVKILAHYADIPSQPPAILLCPIGSGVAVLSGVHIEKNPELFSEILRHLAQHPAANKMKVKMKNRLSRIRPIIC